MTFIPAEEDFGIKFQRVDLKNKPIIEADADLVDSTNRGTTLKKNNVSVYTIEHILAAIEGAQIDNILIEIDRGDRLSITNHLHIQCRSSTPHKYCNIRR